MVESIPGPGLITMPKALTRAENRQEHIMGKLRDDVLENLLGMERFKKVNPVELKTHIEKRLHEFFLSFHTPTHPPYASMIRMAILELNEKGGLSEEAISAFIRREYKGLPWGHDSFLSHYLGKLCGDLDLEKSNDGRYMLPLKNGDSGNIMKRGRKRLRCKGRQGKDKDRNESEELSILVEDVLQESSGSNRQQFEVTTNGEATGQPENAEELRRKRIKSKAEQNKVSEERHKVEMQPIEATEQRIEGNYDHSVFVMERRKECLDEDDGKEIEEEKQQPHMLEDNLVGEQGLIEEQQMDASDQILTSCCDDKGNNGANSRVQSEESSLLVMEAEKHDFSKQEDQPHSKLRPQRSVTRLCPSKISGSSELLEYAEQHSEMCGKERPRQHFCELQQKPKRRGQGRPPKLKPHEDVILGAHLLPNNRYDNEEEQQLEVQASGACPKSNVEADSIMVPSTQSASDGNHDEQSQKQPQQPQVRRRGRPPKLKAKGTTATTLDASLRTSCGEQQQQQAPRRRGRPPKEKKYSL